MVVNITGWFFWRSRGMRQLSGLEPVWHHPRFRLRWSGKPGVQNLEYVRRTDIRYLGANLPLQILLSVISYVCRCVCYVLTMYVQSNTTDSSLNTLMEIITCFEIVTSLWSGMSFGWLVGWSVCHNFLKGCEDTLPCSYRSTFLNDGRYILLQFWANSVYNRRLLSCGVGGRAGSSPSCPPTTRGTSSVSSSSPALAIVRLSLVS